jgi:hypothetical protein
MNRRIWLVCALGGGLAWGQANSGASAASKPAAGDDDQKSSMATPATEVAMDAPVLTLKGFCPGRKGTSAAEVAASCETVITREQFEKMAAAIRPNMTATVKQQLASLYPRLLVMSHAAEELGLDQQPPYDQMIVFSRMQILTQGLTHKLQEDSANVSDREIADYYKKNPEAFEEYTLERLFVPLRRQTVASKAADKEKNQANEVRPKLTAEEDAAQQLASERELQELAEKLRARAAAGEDFLKLQQQAFEAAGVKVASPTTSMGKVRRTALPAMQVAIFELKVGEVSQVVSDTGGHYIYKLQAKDRLTMEEAKGEIRDTLKGRRLEEALDKIQASYTTETNEAYFGSPPKRGQ